jgi:hypothetical protein
MNMQNFIQSFFFMGIVLMLTPAHGQDYIVTTKGDTISGEVKPILTGVEKKVSISSPDKKKVTYSILQVKSFQLKGETYHTIRTATGYTFMKLLQSGYLSLYAFQVENQNTFSGLFLKKKDGAILEVPNLNFKKMMKTFLQDCPVVADSIETGKWSKRELDQIVTQYNNCISLKSAPVNTITQAPIVQGTDETPHWDMLEIKIKDGPEFESKNDALDMIADVKAKIARGEKIPNYLIKALKAVVSETDFLPELERALNETSLKK